jgi:hypothetical protein
LNGMLDQVSGSEAGEVVAGRIMVAFLTELWL